MSETNFRRERIDRLLQELRYEIERGLMDREIDEEMGYSFIFPRSQKTPDGVVVAEFRMRPRTRDAIPWDDRPPALRVIK